MKKMMKTILSVMLVILCVSAFSPIASAKTATSITLSQTSYTFTSTGTTCTFTATVSPTDATGVIAVSNKTAVAAVKLVSHKSAVYTYKITSKAAGKAKITVKSHGVSASMTVTVQKTKTKIPTYDLMDTYYFTDSNGNNLYSVCITDVELISDRCATYSKNPKQLLLIDYTYDNIDESDGLLLTANNFGIVDGQGTAGYNYLGDFAIPDYKDTPQKVSTGDTCNAQVMFGINNKSSKVKLQFRNNIFGSTNNAYFSLDVPEE